MCALFRVVTIQIVHNKVSSVAFKNATPMSNVPAKHFNMNLKGFRTECNDKRKNAKRARETGKWEEPKKQTCNNNSRIVPIVCLAETDRQFQN